MLPLHIAALTIGSRVRSPDRVPSIVVAILCGCLAGCGSLPPPADGAGSEHFSDAAATELGRLSGRSGAAHGDLSGVRILDSGADAFTQRLALIESAQRSIDAQYYIWNSDLTGQYMAQAIHAAAERGVHVRLLLDDINVAGRDATIAALDSHRNIEIRIYNPFPQRAGVRKMFDLVTDFSRLNRRMHNKSFTVDGAVTIVGGRNIGDEYFDANPDLIFRDRDVVAIGPGRRSDRRHVRCVLEQRVDVFDFGADDGNG